MCTSFETIQQSHRDSQSTTDSFVWSSWSLSEWPMTPAPLRKIAPRSAANWQNEQVFSSYWLTILTQHSKPKTCPLGRSIRSNLGRMGRCGIGSGAHIFRIVGNHLIEHDGRDCHTERRANLMKTQFTTLSQPTSTRITHLSHRLSQCTWAHVSIGCQHWMVFNRAPAMDCSVGRATFAMKIEPAANTKSAPKTDVIAAGKPKAQ